MAVCVAAGPNSPATPTPTASHVLNAQWPSAWFYTRIAFSSVQDRAVVFGAFFLWRGLIIGTARAQRPMSPPDPRYRQAVDGRWGGDCGPQFPAVFPHFF